jgi:hypothetical protein
MPRVPPVTTAVDPEGRAQRSPSLLLVVAMVDEANAGVLVLDNVDITALSLCVSLPLSVFRSRTALLASPGFARANLKVARATSPPTTSGGARSGKKRLAAGRWGSATALLSFFVQDDA